MGISCPLNLIGSLPESLTQGLLVGKLLVGGLGVAHIAPGAQRPVRPREHNLSQGGLPIISTTYLSTVHLKQQNNKLGHGNGTIIERILEAQVVEAIV